jgi:hypothetical protein
VPARGARAGVPIGNGSRGREAVPIAVSAPTASSLLRAESGSRRVPAFVWEIAVAVAAYLVYEAARFVAVGSYPTALAHAHQVVALEQRVHLDVEGGVQDAFLHSPLLTVLNYVYLAAQNLVLPASLVLLYRLNRTTYRTLRNTLLATWLLSLPVYALYPAAPPRLAGLGIVDTVSTGSPLKLEGGTTTSLFNQFAAVPSLHVGFAFAIGIALAAALRNPILRCAALLWGPVMLLTVVATGNHFVFDAIAGVSITAAGYGVHRLIAAGRPARRRVDAYALGRCQSMEPSAAMA